MFAPKQKDVRCWYNRSTNYCHFVNAHESGKHGHGVKATAPHRQHVSGPALVRQAPREHGCGKRANRTQAAAIGHRCQVCATCALHHQLHLCLPCSSNRWAACPDKPYLDTAWPVTVCFWLAPGHSCTAADMHSLPPAMPAGMEQTESRCVMHVSRP